MTKPELRASCAVPAEREVADRRAMLAGIGGLTAGVLLAGARSVQAGPLQPPSGPVISTGKTLSDVEPRRVLRQSDVGTNGELALGEAGSYCFGENIDGAIRLNASDITLDLNGFALTSSGAGPAIGSSETASRHTVRNGRIKRSDDGFSGVSLLGELNVLEDLEVASLSESFFDLAPGVASGPGVTMRRLVCSGFRNGFAVVAGFTPCLISDCIARCRVTGFNIASDNATVEHCGATGGFTQSNIGLIVGANARVRQCIFANYFGGIVAGARATVEECTIQTWLVAGVQVGVGSRVRGCLLSAGSPSPGVLFLDDQCEAIDNHILSTNAINVNGRARCLVARNTVGSPSAGQAITNAGSSLVGPIVSTTAELASASAWANVLV